MEFSVGASITEKDNYLVIYAGSADTKEAYLVDINDPTYKLNLISKREQNIKYALYEHEDLFLYKTNKDDCKNFKIC